MLLNLSLKVQLNSSLLKTGSQKAKRDTCERIGNKQRNKTTKINDIKTMKQTPQNKNSPVTMSVCACSSDSHKNTFDRSQYSAENYFKFYLYSLFY